MFLQQGRHAGQKPARQRVGVNRDGEAFPGALRIDFAALHVSDQVGLHQPQLFHVTLQYPSGRRGAHGLATHQQALAEPRLQAADTQ